MAKKKEPDHPSGGRCRTCGKRMNGMNGRRPAIVDGSRSRILCNLCLHNARLPKGTT